jgi:Ca-activated chloride channel family protein
VAGGGRARFSPLRWLLVLAAAWAVAALTACHKAADAPAESAAGPVFSILAGSELKELEPALIAAATQVGVNIKLSYAGTLDVVERINGGEVFDAVLPPNGAYPSLALKARPAARDKLFYSRIALGVKAAKLAELGWDHKPPGWADIAKAAGSGRLRYAMTNATSSNTGMSALFAVASASAGKTEDLQVADVNAKVLKAFLSGQKLTAGSSGWLAEAFVKAPQDLDAMVNYEAVILRANQQLAPADQLTLVYPRDGMISADYPLMLLNPARMDEYQRLVAQFKGAEFQRNALGPMFLRPANPEVATVAALPSDSVAELAFPNRLEVIDAVLASYLAQWRKPATSIFVLDISGSMEREGRMVAMRDALKVLSGADAQTASARYAAFQSRERVALLLFDDRVEAPVWLRFSPDTMAASRAELLRRAEDLAPRGGTAIYSALAQARDLAIQEVKRDPDRFVSIVLLTDGESNQGLTFADYQGLLAGASADQPQIRVFPILFGEGNVAEMRQLADLTGGRTFDGRKGVLAQVFKEIRGYQ